MTIAKLASVLAKKEGKRSQARIGDIRELLKILVTMEVAYWTQPDNAADNDLSPVIIIQHTAGKKIEKFNERRAKARK